jgi:predicted dithiol-disulfide oxidoreductase (DUF899 family)
MALCIGFGAYCVYDGYFNKDFIAKHTFGDKADSTLVFNRKSPPFLAGVALLLGAYLFVIRGRMVVAEDDGLVINGKAKIAYDSIQKIDKTDFDAKGHFTFTYRGPDGRETDRKLSDKDYDNLKAILDHLVAKIS